MRWFVDVSSVGASAEKQRYCVEADSWQRALQATRSLRADPGPMTGFSIELLDDGFSAVDPVKRQRYAIRKGPADAELTTVAAPPPTSATVPPPPPEERAPSAPPPSASEPPRSRPSSRPAAPELKLLAKGEGRSKSATPPPVSAAPVAASAVVAVNATAAPGPVVAAPATGTPAAQDATAHALEILAKREQEPETSKPLTYREYAYFVEGTPDQAESERLLRQQLVRVQNAILGAGSGKLVNLALFNVRFTGRPPVAPLATLAWKDWRGAPVIAFPAAATGPAPTTAAEASAAPANAPAPVATLTPEPVVAAPPPVVAAALVATAAASPTRDAVVAAPASSASPTPPEPTAAERSEQKAPNEPPASSRSGAAVASNRRSERPGPISTRTPNPKGRLRGDELIADLFESMHELQFLQDSIDGADFCLTLALEKMPAAGGLVHLYDIDRREYVITCAGGAGGQELLHTRAAESDAVISMAMRKRRSLVFTDAQTSLEVRATPRYTTLGGAKSLLVAPVALGGRFLGAIELLNPVDDVPFTDDDGYALSYIAEQLADFVGSRGIMLDREQPAGRLAGSR